MNLDWQLISEDEPIKVGWRKLQRRVYRLPNGKEEEFYVKVEGPFAIAVAQTTEGKFVVAKQFRSGPGKIMHDLPGGQIDKGETPEEAMRRELAEEIGYEAEMLEALSVYPMSATSTAYLHAFLATGCKKLATPPKADDTEFIEPIEVDAKTLLELAQKGEMVDIPVVYLALSKLKLL